MSQLTSKKTLQLFSYIDSYTQEHGWAPSICDMQRNSGITPSHIPRHLALLEQHNIIRRGGGPRMIAINPEHLWKKN